MGRVKHADHCSAANRARGTVQCNRKADCKGAVRTCLYNVRFGAARALPERRASPVFAHADFRSFRPVRPPRPPLPASSRHRRHLYCPRLRACRAGRQEIPQGSTQDHGRIARRTRGRPAGVRARRVAAREGAGVGDERRRRARRRSGTADRVECEPADDACVDDEARDDLLGPVDPRPRLPLAHDRLHGRHDRPRRHAAGQPVHQGHRRSEARARGADRPRRQAPQGRCQARGRRPRARQELLRGLDPRSPFVRRRRERAVQRRPRPAAVRIQGRVVHRHAGRRRQGGRRRAAAARGSVDRQPAGRGHGLVQRGRRRPSAGS